MGRLIPSTTTLSPSQRRDARAKRAKVTLTKDIPALLVAYPRAKRGVEGSVLIVDPPIDSSLRGKEGPGMVEREQGKRRDGERRQGKDSGKVVVEEGSRASGRNRRAGTRGKAAKKGVDADVEEIDDGHGGKSGNEIGGSSSKPTSSRMANSTLESAENGTMVTDSPRSSVPHTTDPENPKSLSNITTPTSATATTTSGKIYSSPRIRILTSDTLTAAQTLQISLTTPPSNPPRIIILNMCSPLRPGGGFLSGATSQEESLCMRTTLYPSLREEFYRLPEVGGVYTRDVLVFREFDQESESGVRDLEKGARWWVDVVSSGILRFPEVEGVSVDGGGDEDGDEGEQVVSRYVSFKDRELVEEKMRAVMRIVKSQGRGVKGLVLGAWGCGAYGNPVSEVAGCWRRVLCGDGGEQDVGGMGKARKGRSGKSAKEAEELEKERESWRDIEIVFAIKERRMVVEFAKWFGGDVQVEMDENGEVDEDELVKDGSDASASELQGKIAELEAQIAGSRSAAQKEMFKKILVTLRKGQEDDDDDE